MREQNCRNARQPANEHRRVLGSRSFFVISVFRFYFSFQLLSGVSIITSYNVNTKLKSLIINLQFIVFLFHDVEHLKISNDF